MNELVVDGYLVVTTEYVNGLLIAIPELSRCAAGSDEIDEFYNAQKLRAAGIESPLAENIAKAIYTNAVRDYNLS